MSYFPPTGSLVAYQILPSSLQAGVSVIGRPPVAVTNTPSISGTVEIGNIIQASVHGIVSVAGGGLSVDNFPLTQNVSGSVISRNILPSSLLVGASIFGQLPAGTAPLGSIAALQGTNPWIITGSVQAEVATGNSSVQVLNFPLTQNVSGSVVAVQSGTVISSLVNIVPSSVIVGASIFGLAPVNVTNTNLNVSGSVVAFQGAGWSGSVAATITNTNVNVSGSVVAFQAGTQSSSVYVMRNDAVASFLGADLTVRPAIGDSAGRLIIKPFTADDSAAFRFQGSVVSASVTLINASAIGMRNYLTDFAISNTGSVATLVTFQDGSTSIIGRTIAPGGGGSNKEFMIPIRTNPSQDLVFTGATQVSVLYVTVTGYRAP